MVDKQMALNLGLYYDFHEIPSGNVYFSEERKQCLENKVKIISLFVCAWICVHLSMCVCLRLCICLLTCKRK